MRVVRASTSNFAALRALSACWGTCSELSTTISAYDRLPTLRSDSAPPENVVLASRLHSRDTEAIPSSFTGSSRSDPAYLRLIDRTGRTSRERYRRVERTPTGAVAPGNAEAPAAA